MSGPGTEPAHGGNEVIERQMRIAARREVVFEFLVDPVRIVRWMGEATIDPQPGGIFRIAYRSGDVARGEVVEVTAPERFVISWGWEAAGDPPPPGASRVELELVEDGDGTLVRVRHSGLAPEARDGHGEGWDWFLPRLQQAVGPR
jgi:uncharacterized protein YndB with AHSA1/START domain